jgi:hypothetical protein
MGCAADSLAGAPFAERWGGAFEAIVMGSDLSEVRAPCTFVRFHMW